MCYLQAIYVIIKYANILILIFLSIQGHEFQLLTKDLPPMFSFIPAAIGFDELGCNPFLTTAIISQQILEYVDNISTDDDFRANLKSHYDRFLGRTLNSSTSYYILKMEYTVTITPSPDSGIEKYMIASHKQYYKHSVTDGGTEFGERYFLLLQF